MKRSYILLALIFSLFLGCSSAEKKVDLPAGVNLLFSGKFQEAHDQFLRRCEELKSQSDCALAGTEWSSPQGLPVLQGFSNSEWARVNVFPAQESKVKYYYRPVGPFALKPVRARTTKGQKGAQLRVDHLDLAVRPGVTYELLILGEDGLILDRRKFSGLKLTVKGKKFVLLSCLDDDYADDQKIMWSRVREQNPDVIFMVGDNIYATKINGQPVSPVPPDQLWGRYQDMVSKFDVYRWEKLTPIWAVWDDHDYGMKNGDLTHPYKAQAKDIFLSFFPQHEGLQGYARGPGISYRVRLDDLDLYFFDNRTFRNSDKNADYGHFGQDQTEWFQNHSKGERRAMWLISGDQFFGGYQPFESFEGSHPKAFRDFIEYTSQIKGPVAFLSGDRHLFELIKVPADQLGYITYEVTSSALHARTYPDAFKLAPSPNMVVGFAGRLNFALLENVQVQGSKMNMKVSAFSKETKPLAVRAVSIERK